ncbi:DNA polymerase III subunit delta' [Sphingobium sp. CR28]|uniref:DNA polymerase III subunit delta' n=1 Tax=Sphingobium sp. CR28 TaxID=3400272 RepID=UPI003FEE5B86
MTRWIGHDAQLADLIDAVASHRLHHGWIFAGPKGIGKAGIATDFAARLLAADQTLPVAPGSFTPEESQTTRLMESGTHPDFLRLERLEKDDKKSEETRLARSITADQARGVARLLQRAPSMSARRVVLVDAADDLEAHGANALLKALEEPPPGAVFLLISHMPGRLLPTIRSRCRMVRFGALTQGDMQQVLAQVMPDQPEAERSVLARASGGSPGRALEYHGLALADLHEALESVAKGGGEGDRARARLIQQLGPASARDRLAAFLDLAPDYLAALAARGPLEHVGPTLAARDEVLRLAEGAIVPYNLEPGAVVRMICDALFGIVGAEPARTGS